MDLRPDPTEKKIRFGCGASLGLVIGVGAALTLHGSTAIVLMILIPIILFGVLATKYGDRFWCWIKDWLWLFWP